MHAGGLDFTPHRAGMCGGDKARIDRQPARADRKIVVAAAVADAAHLHDAQPAAFRAKARSGLFERDHAVRDAVQLQVAGLGGPVVEHQHRAGPARKEVLQGQYLPAVAQRILGQQAQLGEAVQHNAPGMHGFDALHDAAHGFAQLQFGRMQKSLFLVLRELPFGNEFEQVEPLQRPSMGERHGSQLGGRLGQRDVKPALAMPQPFHQKLEGERRLAGAGRSLDEVEPVRRDPACQDIVEPFHARRGARRIWHFGLEMLHVSTFGMARHANSQIAPISAAGPIGDEPMTRTLLPGREDSRLQTRAPSLRFPGFARRSAKCGLPWKQRHSVGFAAFAAPERRPDCRDGMQPAHILC